MWDLFLLAGLLLAAPLAMAATPDVPAEAEKVLGQAPGSCVLTGLVFFNGKFVSAPYRVERRGNGVFVKRLQVPGKTVDWQTFIQTQPNALCTETRIEPGPAPAVEVASEPEPPVEVEAPVALDDDISLDDLFDDNPKPKKKAKAKPAVVKKAKKPAAPPKPIVTKTYTLQGDFEANEASRKLVAGLDLDRQRIENLLKADRFIFFGDAYSMVTGEAADLLTRLPAAMKASADGRELYARAQAGGMPYLSQAICDQLMRNKADYILLEKTRQSREGF